MNLLAPTLSTHQLRDIIRQYAEIWFRSAHENESLHDFAEQVSADLQMPKAKSLVLNQINQMKGEVRA